MRVPVAACWYRVFSFLARHCQSVGLVYRPVIVVLIAGGCWGCGKQLPSSASPPARGACRRRRPASNWPTSDAAGFHGRVTHVPPDRGRERTAALYLCVCRDGGFWEDARAGGGFQPFRDLPAILADSSKNCLRRLLAPHPSVDDGAFSRLCDKSVLRRAGQARAFGVRKSAVRLCFYVYFPWYRDVCRGAAFCCWRCCRISGSQVLGRARESLR
mmetsp:Transcript_3225/g.6424  ORF Transcript_3225/g.6424 Transcript_3225/m.6424 type:complete len:215 (+) Transcript_3225:406-1050(+)